MRSLPLATACQLLLFVLIRKSVCQTAVAVGCFNDRRHEWAFFWWGPGQEYARHSATSCAQYCSQQKFLYAGMTGGMGLDCHCGNGGYDVYGASGACGGCNQRREAFGCGRSNGDLNRLVFVYKIDPPVADIDERHVGCWTSSLAPNVLAPQAQRTDLPANNLTVDACINKCRESSQRYSGLYAGKECWCGSDLQWEYDSRSPAHTAQCNIPCPSNSTEMCGGSNFVNIFRSECRDGTYGLPGKACQPCKCENDGVCEKGTGKCPGPCIEGYAAMTPGGPCLECPDHFYGKHCNTTCNCEASCDKVTGNCEGQCKAGWTKPYTAGPCSNECPEGFYGLGCYKDCNCGGNCSKSSGQCHGDCSAGWMRPKEGEPCSLALPPVPETTTPTTEQPTGLPNGNEQQSSNGDNSNKDEKEESSQWVPIGAGVGAAVVLLALILLVVFFMRRKRQKESHDSTLIQEDITPSTRPSVLAVDNFEAIIDTDPEGNNTLYSIGKLMPVMKQKNQEEKPFYDEFQNLPKGNLKDWDFAETHVLREVKNRFGNVFPYNENRIVLKSANDNDYINASYVKNYAGKTSYIAAQGPISSTVDDFLQMVWQENISKIIMVTNLVEEGKEKCEQYWPKEDGSPEVAREVVLRRTDELMFPDYVVRTFTMTKGGESRQLKHYMFFGWGDHQGLTYASSILSMLENVKKDKVEPAVISNGPAPKELEAEEENHYDNSSVIKENGPVIKDDGPVKNDNGAVVKDEKRTSGTPSEAPWLVHCSAGVGRTGTFIALDYLLDQAKAEGQVDVYECVYKLREQRINMVQSLDQYRFIYIALLKALVIGPTSIACYNFEDTLKELQEPNPETHKSKLFVQFEALEVLKPKHKKTEITEALKPENRDKNRSSEYIPTNQFRPTFDTTYKGSTGYINAVAVKGYKTKFAFLATQLPLENTRQDFWCMVFDYRCPVIVVLQCPEEEIYWPQNENESISYGEFTVQCLTTQRLAGQNINKLTLAVRHKDRTPTTTVLLQVDWPPEVSLLEQKTFFAINDLITTHQHGKSALPVVIQCMYGYARSGLVCALNCLIDMINAEQQADVFQCVQHIRSTRPHFIHSFEQFKFLYSATVYYISTLDSYANFKKL